MVTQVVGRVNGTGLTSIWKSDSFTKDILEYNKYYAEMKPLEKEDTAFLYSSKYSFIAAGNHFQNTATESRSHAVNYYMYMDEKEKKQFQEKVPIDFKKAKSLGDESVAQQDGMEGFFIKELGEQMQPFSHVEQEFSEQEKKMLVDVMCAVKNGISVNVLCEKEKEKSLFKLFIYLFTNFEIGCNVNLGTNISIGINSKIVDCVNVKLESRTCDLPEELSNVLENTKEVKIFWKKVEAVQDDEEFREKDMAKIAKERLEEREWESLGLQKMVWPMDKPKEEDVLMMHQTLMKLYFSCEGLSQREEKFCFLQDLYKRETSRMIEEQVIKPMRDKKYMALLLMLCFKVSPYQQYVQQKQVETYIPAYIYKEEVETFLEEHHVGKIGIMTVWKEIERLVMESVIGG